MERYFLVEQKIPVFSDSSIRSLARLAIGKVAENSKENQRNSELNTNYGLYDAQEIADILNCHKNDAVAVVGPPGIGKSTVAQHIDCMVDMDVMFDTMDADVKKYLLHHEYVVDESTGLRVKRTVPFSDSPAYLSTLDMTTRQLSIYADEFFKSRIKSKTPLIGTTPIHSDKIILLQAKEEDMRRNAEDRSQNTSREIDLRRALYIERLIKRHVYDFIDRRDVIVHNMSYE